MGVRLRGSVFLLRSPDADATALTDGLPQASGRCRPVAPVCTNCGANDFVWVNELKTGTLGGGSLSIRSRGELSLGTRICRACGHADLFLKDPSILRMPHTWRPGEFVSIPSRPPPAPAPASVPAPRAPPTAPPSTPPSAPLPERPAQASASPPPSSPSPAASPPALSEPVVAPEAPPGLPGDRGEPDGLGTDPVAPEGNGMSAPQASRPRRRRRTKPKESEPPPSDTP